VLDAAVAVEGAEYLATTRQGVAGAIGGASLREKPMKHTIPISLRRWEKRAAARALADGDPPG
jgi:hypothetical protein